MYFGSDETSTLYYLRDIASSLKIATICCVIIASYIIYKALKKFINWLNKK